MSSELFRTLVIGGVACKRPEDALRVTQAFSKAVASNSHILAIDMHPLYMAGTSTPESMAIEHEIRDQLRQIEQALAANNNPGKKQNYIHTDAVHVLSTTEFGTFKPIIAEDKEILNRLQELFPVGNWRHCNFTGTYQTSFDSDTDGHKFTVAVNQILTQRKTGFAVEYDALPKPTITVHSLERMGQLKVIQDVDKQHFLNLMMSNLTPNHGK